jgi:hypothetical protein
VNHSKVLLPGAIGCVLVGAITCQMTHAWSAIGWNGLAPALIWIGSAALQHAKPSTDWIKTALVCVLALTLAYLIFSISAIAIMPLKYVPDSIRPFLPLMCTALGLVYGLVSFLAVVVVEFFRARVRP